MWLVKLQKYFANTITFHLKNTLLLWIGHLYQEVKCKTLGQEEFTFVCYYGLSYVKQHMYTTVGAHRHVNWQILSDSYQMVYVLLACFCFLLMFLFFCLQHQSWRPDVFHSSAVIGQNFFPRYTSALMAFSCTFSNISHQIKIKSTQFFSSSIAWGVVAQSPELGAHVLNAQAFRIKLEFRNVGFCLVFGFPFMKSLSLASVQCCRIEVLQKHLNHHINLKSTLERATF